MSINTPAETYEAMLKSAEKKSSSFYSDDKFSKAMATLLYSCLFPGGLVAIVFTGSELFTGNTVTMFMGVMAKKQKIGDLLRVWLISFAGNLLGAIIVAQGISYIDANNEGNFRNYLSIIATAKLAKSHIMVLFHAIGCNALVCLAVWQAASCKDGISKIIAIWFPITSFVVAGFEHIVANMYTLILATISIKEISLWTVIWRNLLPVTFGNILSGVIVTGAVWWYNFDDKTKAVVTFPIDVKPDIKSEQSKNDSTPMLDKI